MRVGREGSVSLRGVEGGLVPVEAGVLCPDCMYVSWREDMPGRRTGEDWGTWRTGARWRTGGYGQVWSGLTVQPLLVSSPPKCVLSKVSQISGVSPTHQGSAQSTELTSINM